MINWYLFYPCFSPGCCLLYLHYLRLANLSCKNLDGHYMVAMSSEFSVSNAIYLEVLLRDCTDTNSNGYKEVLSYYCSHEDIVHTVISAGKLRWTPENQNLFFMLKGLPPIWHTLLKSKHLFTLNTFPNYLHLSSIFYYLKNLQKYL